MACVDALHQCLLKLMNYDLSSGQPAPRSLSTSTRGLRNDLVVILSLHVHHCPNSPYVETGLLQTLIMLCSSPEIPEQVTGCYSTYRQWFLTWTVCITVYRRGSMGFAVGDTRLRKVGTITPPSGAVDATVRLTSKYNTAIS